MIVYPDANNQLYSLTLSCNIPNLLIESTLVIPGTGIPQAIREIKSGCRPNAQLYELCQFVASIDI